MKKCKGTHKDTYGLGCGKLTEYRVLGLGKMCGCYSGFLLETEAGKLRVIRHALKASQKVKKQNKKKDNQETKQKKLDLMTADKYRANYLQPVLNKIARKIDFGQPCIATGLYGKMSGGHFYSVGSNRTTALNLHNIHIQSFHSNSVRGGDERRYALGLEKIYSKKYLEFVRSLKQIPVLKLSKLEMIDIYPRALKLCNSIDDIVRDSDIRLELRNNINHKLGIYDDKYCFY